MFSPHGWPNWGDGWTGRSFLSGGGNIPLARGPDDRKTDAAALAGFGSWHPGICQFLFIDGSVHALRNSEIGGAVSATTGEPTTMGTLWMLADCMDGGIPNLD